MHHPTRIDIISHKQTQKEKPSPDAYNTHGGYSTYNSAHSRHSRHSTHDVYSMLKAHSTVGKHSTLTTHRTHGKKTHCWITWGRRWYAVASSRRDLHLAFSDTNTSVWTQSSSILGDITPGRTWFIILGVRSKKSKWSNGHIFFGQVSFEFGDLEGVQRVKLKASSK